MPPASLPPGSSPRAARALAPLLAAGALLTFVLGLAMPLTDADLGLHLRLGEWIALHGRVPFVEPFAWTRAGAPFYAYSWLAEVVFYEVLRAVGPWGLHALQGLTTLGAAAAAWWLARTLRLSTFAASLFVAAHLLVLITVSAALRPQGVLSVAVPLCWVAALRLADVDAPAARWPYVLLFAATAVAANVHLLAPLCLAPLVLVVPEGEIPVRRALGAAGATIAGLLATPYALRWPAVLRLNFAPNALFRFPSPIAEHQPGFVHAVQAKDLVLVFGVALALLPWLLPRPVWPRRVAGALLTLGWLAGLVLFAVAAKALLLWWLGALPLMVVALSRLAPPSPSPVGRVLRAMPAVLLAVLTVRGAQSTGATRMREGDVAHRTIAAQGAAAALALADTLDALAPSATGRVLTSFDYGNALTWRLPRYSMSIDGRTIFPDSAAAMDGWVVARVAPDSMPWVAGSADLAILPASHAAIRRLARTAGWQHVADARVRVNSESVDSAALWARTAWLTRRARTIGASVP